MSNFDYKKYLVENKLTAGSRLSENVDTLQWPDAIRNFITTNLSSDEKELYLVVKALEKTLESFKNEMGKFDPDFHYVNENESTLPSEDEIKRKGAVGDSVTVSKNGKNYDINYTVSSESDDEMSFGVYDSEEGEDAEQIEEFYTYKELVNWFNN